MFEGIVIELHESLTAVHFREYLPDEPFIESYALFFTVVLLVHRSGNSVSEKG